MMMFDVDTHDVLITIDDTFPAWMFTDQIHYSNIKTANERLPIQWHADIQGAARGLMSGNKIMLDFAR